MSIYSHTPINKVRQRKKPFKYLLFTTILLLIVTFLISFTVEKKRETKPFFHALDTPLVIAHRGGSTYPENTILAFQHATEIGVDIIEFDIHMTKDGHLVVIHDDTVDRTTNGTGAVGSFSLEKLKQLDAGYSFAGLEGNFPYRNQGVTIPTVREVFEQFPSSYMNIEIKAQYPNIEETLWELIKEYKLENKVLLSSFNQNIITKFNEVTNGKVAIGGGKKEVTKLVLLQKFFLGNFYYPKVDVIQIPTEANRFNLADRKLIRRVSNLNMKTLYWTINDEAEMKKLLMLGADGIITDNPDLLIRLMKQLGLR